MQTREKEIKSYAEVMSGRNERREGTNCEEKLKQMKELGSKTIPAL